MQNRQFSPILCLHCDLGYVGRDCSLAADAVPVISVLRRGCMCDVRQVRCRRVFVTVDNIYDSANLTCSIQSADDVCYCNYI